MYVGIVGLRRECDSTMDKMCVSRRLERSAEARHRSDAGLGVFSLCRARLACFGRSPSLRERVSSEGWTRRKARGGGRMPIDKRKMGVIEGATGMLYKRRKCELVQSLMTMSGLNWMLGALVVAGGKGVCHTGGLTCAVSL